MGAVPTAENSQPLNVVADWKSRRPLLLWLSLFVISPLCFGFKELNTVHSFDGWVAMDWGVALVYLSFCLYLVLRTQNERIVIRGDRISWIDWLGRARVTSLAIDVLQGTFLRHNPILYKPPKAGDEVGTGFQSEKDNYRYSVDTKEGEIRWNATICNLKALNAAISQLAHQPDGPIDAPRK